MLYVCMCVHALLFIGKDMTFYFLNTSVSLILLKYLLNIYTGSAGHGRWTLRLPPVIPAF